LLQGAMVSLSFISFAPATVSFDEASVEAFYSLSLSRQCYRFGKVTVHIVRQFLETSQKTSWPPQHQQIDFLQKFKQTGRHDGFSSDQSSLH